MAEIGEDHVVVFKVARWFGRQCSWLFNRTKTCRWRNLVKVLINYPSFCPNPEPGTVEIPVASKSLRQYKTSGTFPNCLAASIALGGSCICGNEYMAPVNKFTCFFNLISHSNLILELKRQKKKKKCRNDKHFTFSEIADYIFAAVKSISHYSCSSP